MPSKFFAAVLALAQKKGPAMPSSSTDPTDVPSYTDSMESTFLNVDYEMSIDDIINLDNQSFDEILRQRHQRGLRGPGGEVPAGGSGALLPPPRESPGSIDRLQQQVNDLSASMNTFDRRLTSFEAVSAETQSQAAKAINQMRQHEATFESVRTRVEAIVEDLRTFLGQLAYQGISPVKYASIVRLGLTLKSVTVQDGADGSQYVLLSLETPDGSPTYQKVQAPITSLGYFKAGDMFDLILRPLHAVEVPYKSTLFRETTNTVDCTGFDEGGYSLVPNEDGDEVYRAECDYS